MNMQTIEQILPYIEWLVIVSSIAFFLSIFLIPWYIARLPSDYFLKLYTNPADTKLTPARIALLIIRNIIGTLLLAAGIIMLFIPGQGILTIVIGVLCMSFPGKRKLALSLINRRSVQNSLDWARRKMNRTPFHWQN